MKAKQARTGPKSVPPSRWRGQAREVSDKVRIYGVHAAEAALANPARQITAIHATPNAAQRVAAMARPGLPEITPATPKDLDRMLGADTVHQGILIEAAPLPELSLTDLPDARLILVLDQITDPHNVGAILRSASAFGVDAVVTTARHSPPLGGALAKAACGALEHVPVILVPNLARAMVEIGEAGFMRVGLDSDGETALEALEAPERAALVLGAEDKGLRRLTREHCEAVCALTTFGAIGSLNVSNAAAIALHLISHKIRSRPAL